jgi:cytochrome c553
MSQSEQFPVSVASRWSARVAAVVLWCAVGDTAWAQAADPQARLKESASNPALADTLAALGRKAAAVCANCHGEGGTSVQANVPNLAAQNPAYLLDQMSQFADGRRKNEFMQGMIKAMKVDERAGVAMYYAAQKLTLPAPVPSPLVEQGKALYGRNCFRCHGADGLGSEAFARIAGQQAAYVAQTLKRYRAGTGPRVNELMAANTKLLTDGDIQALAAYVASMR